ncbi:MAG: DMT family transporter [Accumulibacter sp.]|uniref:DMT family transporter n=1 Tax=Accumulibacter sp. TaxID=2053492 RepID=UPI002FC35903
MADSHAGERLSVTGVLFCLLALFLFSALDATAKYLSSFLAVPLLVWARYLVQLLLMLLSVAPRLGRSILFTRRPGLMALRGVTLAGVTLLGQMALTTLPLAETTAMVFVAPLLVALLAGPLLHERVGLRTWLATLAGFCGVLLIARPGGSLSAAGVACALGAALFYAAYQLLTRKLVASEPPLRLLFHTALFGTLALTPLLSLHWDGRLPSLGQGLLIVSLGVYGGVGHFLLIRALQRTPASLLSPLLYGQLVWATLLGWLVFAQLPDALTMAGMLIIGAAGLSLAVGARAGGLAG